MGGIWGTWSNDALSPGIDIEHYDDSLSLLECVNTEHRHHVTGILFPSISKDVVLPPPTGCWCINVHALPKMAASWTNVCAPIDGGQLSNRHPLFRIYEAQGGLGFSGLSLAEWVSRQEKFWVRQKMKWGHEAIGLGDFTGLALAG